MLRGDIVKVDSGARAVFTEQGSSASQMTAAKVMDVIANYLIVQDKPPTQYPLTPMSKWRTLQGCSKCQRQSVQIYGYVFHDTCGSNHGQTSKTPFFSTENCTDTRLPASCGKESSEKFCWDLDGKKYRIGNVFLFTGTKDCSYLYTWMISKLVERCRIWLPCGRN